VSNDSQQDSPADTPARDVTAAPTIRQVAAMAGVSTATVSRVLSQSGRVSPELETLVRNADEAEELDV